MNIQYPFRSSKSRLTKQQEQMQLINQQIIDYMLTIQEDKDAESIWLEIRANGLDISHSSFNTKLKKLVDAGLIEKISFGYNKNSYRIQDQKMS
jgi:Fe2+ or Zn2+ uptake regulation protein